MSNRPWVAACLLAAVLGGGSLLVGAGEPRAGGGKEAARPEHSAAYEWLDVALEATAREHDRNAPRPTIGSRMLAMIVTAMYDAWAAYDDKAVGTRLGDKLRRPPAEHT